MLRRALAGVLAVAILAVRRLLRSVTAGSVLATGGVWAAPAGSVLAAVALLALRSVARLTAVALLAIAVLALAVARLTVATLAMWVVVLGDPTMHLCRYIGQRRAGDHRLVAPRPG